MEQPSTPDRFPSVAPQFPPPNLHREVKSHSTRMVLSDSAQARLIAAHEKYSSRRLHATTRPPLVIGDLATRFSGNSSIIKIAFFVAVLKFLK
jgi:hypothetical protein